MANEIRYSGLGDLRLSAALGQELNLLLADRFSLRGHPSILRVGDPTGMGSTSLEVPYAGLMGYDRMAAVSEGSAASNSALTDASPGLTIARQQIRRQYSDLAAITDIYDMASMWAADIVAAAGMRFTEMIVNVTDDFSSSVGTSGVDMSVDDWYDAQFALTQGSVPGPYFAILYPTQFTDFQNSLRSEGGAAQWNPATQEMLRIKGPGFVGEFNGVEIYTSSLVPTANGGADSAGAMFGLGAVGYIEANAPMVDGAAMRVNVGPIAVEVSRDASIQESYYDGVYYVGVGILETGRGRSIITDR